MCEGLTVTGSQNQVTVSPGMAIDPQGRQMILELSKSFDLTANRPPGGQTKILNLFLSYEEVASDLATEGSEGNRRWHEQCKLEAKDQSESQPSESVKLAKLTMDSAGNVTVDATVCEYSGLRLPKASGNGAVLRYQRDGSTDRPVFNGELKVTGDVTLDQALSVSGNTTVGGTLSVTGNTSLSGNLSLTGNTSLNTLNVTGNTTLSSTTLSALTVTGNSSLNTLNVTGNTTLRSTSLSALTVSGNTTLSALTVSGNTTLNTLSVSGNTTLGSTNLSALSVTGNVGIGTTSPSEKLEVNGSIKTDIALISNNAGTSYATFSHKDSSGSDDYAIAQHSDGTTYINSKTGRKLYFCIDDSTKMTVKSDGKVGIGTTSPTETLEVNGNVKVNGTVQANRNKVVTSEESMGIIASTSWNLVGEYSVTITTNGGPVLILVNITTTTASSGIFLFTIFRDNTNLGNESGITSILHEHGSSSDTRIVPLIYLDNPSVGTFTYQLQAKAGNADQLCFVNNSFSKTQMIAIEL